MTSVHASERSQNDRSHIRAVDTREELIYLLSRACELEHGLACIYLFAAYSLKNGTSEGGLNEAQADMVRGWKRRLAGVAVEEMLHLAQVTNMLTAIGGAPHFRRANFPMPATAYPFGICLTLEPFSLRTIERFVCYEMPEAGILSAEQQAIYDPIRARIVEAEGGLPSDAGDGGAPIAAMENDGAGCEPFDVDFKTVGEFYHKIGTGFSTIPEDELFIGPPEAQANARFVDLGGQLIAVVDGKSACAAIEMIVEQGEAPSTAHPDAHFNIFDSIRLEYSAALDEAARTGAPFEPVRPVVPNPMTRFYDDAAGGTIVRDPASHAAADLFNVAYDTMLLMLLRFFSHTDESQEELETLSRATLRLMTTVLRPIGEALAKMPLGDARLPGTNAGPGFGYNRDVHLLPHKRSAWIFFAERLRALSAGATGLQAQVGLPREIEEAAAALQALEREFAAAAGFPNATVEPGEPASSTFALESAIDPELDGPYLVTNVRDFVNSNGEPLGTLPEMALCRCGGSGNKPFCDGTHARIGFSSRKLPGRVPDRRDTYDAPGITVHDNRGICQHAGFCTDELPAVFRIGQEPFVDVRAADPGAVAAQVRRCPSGALGYSLSGVEHRDHDRTPQVTISKNGPYRVTGGIPLRDDSWGEGASREHYALCRCGGSKNKPFCDGTHWSNNFHDERN